MRRWTQPLSCRWSSGGSTSCQASPGSGILYFFNLVNVPFMKSIDAPTKGKVIPNMLAPALWYFRWGAVVTVLSGRDLLRLDRRRPKGPTRPWASGWSSCWWPTPSCTTASTCRRSTAAPRWRSSSSWVIAAMSFLIAHHAGFASSRFPVDRHRRRPRVMMFLNVWGIIWRHQKEDHRLDERQRGEGDRHPGRVGRARSPAFLASRSNAWMSLPMLFFMGHREPSALFGA